MPLLRLVENNIGWNPGPHFKLKPSHADAGSSVELGPVRFISGDQGAIWGQPTIEGAHVKATILRNGRTRSITVFKKKRRKNYRRTKGHRQEFSHIRIDEIVSA